MRLNTIILIAASALPVGVMAQKPSSVDAASCTKPVYLTLDTGHMGVAQQMADVLRAEKVQVTFFAANERTKEGDGSLGTHWAPWWKARAAEGHAFASHTWDHTYWRADTATGFTVRPSQGARAGQSFGMTKPEYCAEIQKSEDRLQQMTGVKPLPLFRAPGGKTSPALIAAAQQCGYQHVGWSPSGFLGDELPSDKYPNAMLLDKALKNIRSGDILLAHLGIWDRKDPWAPAVLQPLIQGLKAQGFCFSTLRDHPQYREWIRTH